MTIGESFEIKGTVVHGTEYYYISDRGKVVKTQWLESPYDYDRLEFHNIYETESEALQAVDIFTNLRRAKSKWAQLIYDYTSQPYIHPTNGNLE